LNRSPIGGEKLYDFISKTIIMETLVHASRGESVPGLDLGPGFDPGVLDRTTALCRGLDIILQHHGCRLVVRREIIEQIESYLNTSSSEKVWLVRAKYLTTYPNAKYLKKNDLPPQPDLPFKFKGSARKWVKNRIFAFNARNSHLWYSWFQAKRCSLPASDDFVEATYDDHFRSLSRSDTGDPTVIKQIFENRTFLAVLNRVKKEVARDIKCYFAGDLMEKNIVDLSLTGSSSACFERPRSREGQLGELQQLVGLRSDPPKSFMPDEDEPPPLPPCMGEDCVDCLSYGPDPDLVESLNLRDSDLNEISSQKVCFPKIRFRHYSRQFSRHLGTSEFYNCQSLTTDLFSMEFVSLLYERRPAELRRHVVLERRQPTGWDCWDSLKDRLGEWEFHKPCRAMIQAVREPFKVRVISKGNALPYYSCRRLQKILWKSLSEISCFRLISRPFCPTDLIDLKRRASVDWEWLSIDYSAATDGLSYEYSRRIMEYILEGQPDRVVSSALSVLGPHELFYPDDKEVSRGLQRNGQLMGSILSFPILCLANLGTYLRSMESQQHDWRDGEILSHVLVNGDDMVYAGPPGMFEFHSSIANSVGLKMSVGKAYHHRTYLNINSMAVHYDLRFPCEPREIPYLNVGLYFGLHKVQGAEDHHSEDLGVFSNVNHLMRGSLRGRERDILDGYLKLHNDQMVKESTVALSFSWKRGYQLVQRNWFLPISSGGMGIVPPKGWRFFVRPVDGLIAKNIFLSDRCPKTTQFPLPGYPVEKFDEAIVPWVKPMKLFGEEGEYIDVRRLSIPSIRIFCPSGFRKKRARMPILRFTHSRLPRLY